MTQIVYTLAAFGVVPGLLGLFHWLSRGPKPAAPAAPTPSTAQAAPEVEATPASLADEAERWLQSQV